MKVLFLVLQIFITSFNIVLGESIDDAIRSSVIEGNTNSKICPRVNISNSHITKNCLTLQNADSLTQAQLIFRLTAPCRYDRFERPFPVFENKCSADQPLHIYARLYIYTTEIMDSNDLNLKIFGFLQLRYTDFRLAFGDYAPNHAHPILGDMQIRDRIWVPQILFANEQSSDFLGTSEKYVSTIVMPDGILRISTRIQASLCCWVALNKFPFDDQQCSAIIESWMYNSSEVILHWENEDPIVFDQNIHLSEYVLQDYWNNESVVQKRKGSLRYSLTGGNYSSISFTFYLIRDSRFYTMAYFLPSIMLVCISWVSFWLQADQTPARTTLGTSTMLSLFTLTSSYEKEIDGMSYPKFFEVWFFGCTFFIFGSLIEFAFVNTIWRRNRCLKLKKVNSKYILKSTLTPKAIPQKNIYDCETDGNINCFNKNVCEQQAKDDVNINRVNQIELPHDETWFTMAPHEVSLWIDRKARFVFPLLFTIFNAVYWTIVFCL